MSQYAVMILVIVGIKASIKSIIYNALILLGYLYLFDFVVFSMGGISSLGVLTANQNGSKNGSGGTV